MQQHPDFRFIVALVGNDSRVVREIYDRYRPLIVRLVTRNRGSQQDAEDMFQDGLMTVMQMADREGFVLSSTFGTLLYGVCRYKWLNRIKGKSFSQRVRIVDDITFIEEPLVEKWLVEEEQLALFREKMGLLGERCQRVLRLYFDSVGFRKIAALMSYKNEHAATQQKYKCRERLIKLIKSDRRYKELTDE